MSSINPQWDQSNQGVIELLADWLNELGFDVEVIPVTESTAKYNLIANVGQGPGGLLLSGHTDTVPFEEENWQSDPFKLIERNNRLYGLGTTDMKAFFAIVIEAVRELDLSRLKHPLTILATADEESTMSGARVLAETGRRLGRYAIIGEPTGLKPVRMHKGIAIETIRVLGRSGHSSNPALGNSALEGMHLVIGSLLQWRRELQDRYQNSSFAVAVPTLNLGRIHGGDNPNRNCAECELQIDIRQLPGMDLTSLRTELRQRLEPLMRQCGLKLELHSPFTGIPAMETPVDAEIVKITEQLTGHTATAVAFGTEAPYLQQLGLETLILGPGDIDQAHQSNEYLSLDRINPMMNLLQAVIRRLCL